MRHLFLASALSCLLLSTEISTFEWNGVLDLTFGYRDDQVFTELGIFDPSNVFALSDSLKARHLSIYEIGFDGRMEIYDNFFVRGYGTLGTVDHGSYFDQQITDLGAFNNAAARIRDGRTLDGSIGVGYLYPVHPCFTLGPVVGWAYDQVRIKMHDAFTNDIPNPILNGLNYTTSWQGPWLGVETAFIHCLFDVHAGYEYHWAHWKGDWTLAGPDVFGGSFSDRRKANHAYGNVFFVNARTVFWDFLDVGLSLKYFSFRATNGEEFPRAGSFPAVGLRDTEVDRVRRAGWRSVEFQILLGYSF